MMSRMRQRNPSEWQPSRDRSKFGQGSNGVRVRFDEWDWVMLRRGEDDAGDIVRPVRRVAWTDKGGDVQELVVPAGIGRWRDRVGGENVDLQRAQSKAVQVGSLEAVEAHLVRVADLSDPTEQRLFVLAKREPSVLALLRLAIGASLESDRSLRPTEHLDSPPGQHRRLLDPVIDGQAVLAFQRGRNAADVERRIDVGLVPWRGMDETDLGVGQERSEEGEQSDAEEEIDGFAAALPPHCSRRLFVDIVVKQVVAYERAGGGTTLRRDPNELRERERRGADDEVDKDGTATALRPFESVSVPG